MKAIDLIISKGRAISKAEARRLILQGGLRINGEQVITGDNVNELELQLNPGDKIQIGRQEFLHEDVQKRM